MLQPATTDKTAADTIAALEVNRRKHETILRNLRAYQQMKPSSRRSQAIRDNEKTLADITAAIARLRKSGSSSKNVLEAR
jgi:hypothetical protein